MICHHCHCQLDDVQKRISDIEARNAKLEKVADAVRVYLHGPYPDGKNPEDLLADINDALAELES